MSDNNNQLKILILMAYYNRPLLVRNALNSIVKADQHHQNWVLLFGDDGSPIPGKPIAEEILCDHKDKLIFAQSNMTLQEKLEKGLAIGHYANQAIKDSDADLAIILCDDDELFPTYLADLNRFFTNNSNTLYCYSRIVIFNPLIKKSSDVDFTYNKYNQWTTPINPVGKVDASQVAWRLDCCKKYGAWFAESTKFVEGKPWTKDTDRSFFENLYQKCGECHPTDFMAQYKGIHDYQLLWHKNVTKESLIAYDQKCRKIAGEKI